MTSGPRALLLVDWLGRGGIAQTTESWAIEAGALGCPVEVVTRFGRELGSGGLTVRTGPERRTRLGSHVELIRLARRTIEERRPEIVLIQNYVLPALEASVHRAARRAGARCVFVVHDHRLHTRLAGSGTGLRQLVEAADDVVAHTPFVAGAVRTATRRADVAIVPHPVQVGMLAAPRPAEPVLPEVVGADDRRLAVHFGVLRRKYKGSDLVGRLAREGVPGWRFGFLGVGAHRFASASAVVVPGFIAPGALVSAVEQSDATVLPYRTASQSGAVVLAQVLGSAVLASAVGGIGDQIEHGKTGFLLPAGAPAPAWRRALEQLQEPGRRADMAARAKSTAWGRHEEFVGWLEKLVR